MDDTPTPAPVAQPLDDAWAALVTDIADQFGMRPWVSECIARHRPSIDAARSAPDNGYEQKVRKDFDDAIEDVHRAFCDPDHEMVGPWDRDMADAIRRNGYVLSRSVPDNAALRAVLIDVLGDALDGYGNPESWADVILARLDAARSVPDNAALRVETYDDYNRGTGPISSATRPALAAALASPAGLDVERLAEALQAWWSGDGHMPGSDDWHNSGGWAGDAETIIREYAALASPQEAP